MVLLEPGLVPGHDVQEVVVDADFVQVVGNILGALKGRRQVVEALHATSPANNR
jgi:hypothetical protein